MLALRMRMAASGGVVGAAMELISSQALGADAASITFSSIPQTYAHLQLVFFGRGTVASEIAEIRMKLNTDAGVNYDYQHLYGNQTSAFASESLADGFLSLGQIAGGSATAGIAGGGAITLFDYARTSWQKGAVYENARKRGTASAYLMARVMAHFWRSTAAITSVEIYPSSDNLASGTIASLYGIKG